MVALSYIYYHLWISKKTFGQKSMFLSLNARRLYFAVLEFKCQKVAFCHQFKPICIHITVQSFLKWCAKYIVKTELTD